MNLVYNAIFRIANLITGLLWFLLYPFIYLYLRSKRYQHSMSADFPDIGGGFLIHAASVGEVNAVKPLIMRLLRAYPDRKVMVTTNTLNGLKTAGRIDPRVLARLAPLDLQHLRLAQMRSCNPGMIIIVETELWLNLLWAAHVRQMPIVWVNARMSERSLRLYRKIIPLLRSYESVIKCICAQSETDAHRFSILFRIPVRNCGNLKFALDLPELDGSAERTGWGYEAEDFIVTCGSTRPGEERIIADIFRQLKSVIPRLKIIMAIRHPERLFDAVRDLGDINCSLHSQYVKPQGIHVIDSIGHLNEAYAICDIAIVGGSFFDFGGHNPLEPSFYRKPILMGKHYRSCADTVGKLLENGAIVLTDEGGLATEIHNLYANSQLRSEMGEKAKSVLTQYQHSLSIHLDEIMRVTDAK